MTGRAARAAQRIAYAFRSLRLRARIIGAFGLGGFLLSVLLAGSTYSITRSVILSQREDASEQQFFLNAQQVQSATRTGDVAVDEIGTLLQGLPNLAGSRPIVNTDAGAEDSWSSPSLSRQDLPNSLIETVAASDGALAQRMRYSVQGTPRLALGLHFPSSDVLYFEVVDLDEIADTLGSLALILTIATVVTTLAGVGLGVWISGRVLRPLADISDAAQALAGGRLETRLQEVDDPDLATLVTSFNGMASALEARIERDTRFASDVSHELRSPLMTLRASIDVLQSRREELSDRSQHALDLLTDDVDRFQQLVQDLLEISRVDAGAVDLEVDEIHFVDLVTHAVRSSQDGADTRIDVSPEVTDAIVRGDKRRLAQVVTNLLDNARKYGGGATLVSLKGDRRAVRLAVEDGGPGVPDDEKELVFERFARGTAAGARGSGAGAGLGLALVAEHVRLHHGDVWVGDRLDGAAGARFVVELPRATVGDGQ